MSECFPPAGRGQDSCLCVGVSACECVKLYASQRQQVRNERIRAFFSPPMHLESVTPIKTLVAHLIRTIQLLSGVIDFIFNGRVIKNALIEMYFPVVEVCFCCVLYRNLPPHPQMASDAVHRK